MVAVTGDPPPLRSAAPVGAPRHGSTWDRVGRSPWALAALLSLPALTGVGLGYGTDIDVANVLRAGQSALDGDYRYSRPPGSIVHEVATRLLDQAGGSAAVVAASVVMATVALAALGALVRSEGRPLLPTMGLVAVSPWWWVAATSLGDFVWAVAALLSGAVAARGDRRILAGLAFGLAISFRSSSALLVAAWLVAERLGAGPRPSRRATFVTVVTVAVVASAAFLPSWLAAGRSTDFLANEFEVAGPVTLVGRWLVKNLAFWGLAVLITLAVSARHLGQCVGQWPESVLVRFGVLGFLSSQAVFLRFPWKPLHLLPALVGLALVLSVSSHRALRVALVLGSLLHGVVAVTVASPDQPHHATTGRLALTVTDGVVRNDVRCRLDDRQHGPWPSVGDPAADLRALDNFDCQGRLWRSDPPTPAG